MLTTLLLVLVQIRAIVPVWNENLCFDTFPSGTQLSDYLKLVLQQLAQKESANKKLVSDDEDSDADESGEQLRCVHQVCKFGLPANEHCEAVFQTESVDDARSNKSYNRKRQRESKSYEKFKEERASTRGVSSNKKVKSEDTEDPFVRFNELIEVEQRGNYFKELFHYFPHRQEEFAGAYEEFLISQIQRNSEKSNE